MGIPLFDMKEKEVSVTAFRRRPRDVYDYVDVPGHVVLFTKRGKRICVMMSIETYACLTGSHEETMKEIEAKCSALMERKKYK